MQRYTSLVLLVLFLLVGPSLLPSTGWGADKPVKTTVATTPASVKKVSAEQPASNKKTTTSAPATRKTTPTKATTKKDRPPEKQAATTRTQTTVSKKADVAADTKAKSRKTTKNTASKQPPAKPVEVTTQAPSSRPPASQTSRKKKRSSAASAAVAGTAPDIAEQISSKSVMIMDAATGEAIYAKAPDEPRQPASTIKIVTGMIALKSLKNDDVVHISPKAAGMPSSKVNLDPRQTYKADDLINSVLLASANDASVALAEGISGSEEQFANLMTMSARMWGANNTICRTASGLTAEGQHSTARDLANLFRYAMRHEDFARRIPETHHEIGGDWCLTDTAADTVGPKILPRHLFSLFLHAESLAFYWTSGAQQPSTASLGGG